MKKRNVWLLLLASLGMLLAIPTSLPTANANAAYTASFDPQTDGTLIKVEYKDNGVNLIYRMPDGQLSSVFVRYVMDMAVVKDSDMAHLTYYSEFTNSKVNNALKEALMKWNKALGPIGYHLSLVNDPDQAMFTISDDLLTDPSTPSLATVNKDNEYNILGGKIQISPYILNASSQQVQSSFEHEVGHTIGQADTSMLK